MKVKETNAQLRNFVQTMISSEFYVTSSILKLLAAK